MTEEKVFTPEEPKKEAKLTPEEQWAESRQRVMDNLYNNDPLVRELMDAEKAIEESRGKPQPKQSPFEYDEEGNLCGVKPEYKGKVSPLEQMRAIKANQERKFGGKE